MDVLNVTHLVLKHADIRKHCSILQEDSLWRAALAVAEGREGEGKKPIPEYIIVNTDEPYIDEIVEVMKRHGHWGVK